MGLGKRATLVCWLVLTLREDRLAEVDIVHLLVTFVGAYAHTAVACHKGRV
jgi:hypothetical protein